MRCEVRIETRSSTGIPSQHTHMIMKADHATLLSDKYAITSTCSSPTATDVIALSDSELGHRRHEQAQTVAA